MIWIIFLSVLFYLSPSFSPLMSTSRALSERFGRILVDSVGTDKLKSWAKVNRGAMVLCRWECTHAHTHTIIDTPITRYTVLLLKWSIHPIHKKHIFCHLPRSIFICPGFVSEISGMFTTLRNYISKILSTTNTLSVGPLEAVTIIANQGREKFYLIYDFSWGCELSLTCPSPTRL